MANFPTAQRVRLEDMQVLLVVMADTLLDLDQAARGGKIDLMALTDFRCPVCKTVQNSVKQAHQLLCSDCVGRCEQIRKTYEKKPGEALGLLLAMASLASR